MKIGFGYPIEGREELGFEISLRLERLEFDGSGTLCCNVPMESSESAERRRNGFEYEKQ